MRAYPSDLCLCTTLERPDADGEPVETDVIVYFEARMTARGCRPSWTDPGWAPEYEVTFSSADVDGTPGDGQAPLTTIEIATLRAWFDAQSARAFECANDNYDREGAA